MHLNIREAAVWVLVFSLLVTPSATKNATRARIDNAQGDGTENAAHIFDPLVEVPLARDLRSSRSYGRKRKGRSKGYRSSRSTRGESKGREVASPRTIFEIVKFEVTVICGSRARVANDLETAFLAFFEEEDEKCDSDRDVKTFVLLKFEESPSCSYHSYRRGLEAADKNFEQSRQLQFIQPSEGEGGKESVCETCRRRRRLLDHTALDFDEIGNVRRDLHGKGKGGSKSKGSKGGSKSKGRKGKSKGRSKSKYSKDLGEREGRYRPKRRKDKGKGKGKGGPPKKCPADLAGNLRDVGFDDVIEAEITSIEEVDCSIGSKDCKSRQGACCGACGCQCKFPSESLCDFYDNCLGQARPFDADFCEDFASIDSGECEKDYCYESKSRRHSR